MSKRYKKDVYVDAIEFDNSPGNHQAIIDFSGLPISVEYTSDGVQLRVIRGAYSVLIAKLGNALSKRLTARCGYAARRIWKQNMKLWNNGLRLRLPEPSSFPATQKLGHHRTRPGYQAKMNGGQRNDKGRVYFIGLDRRTGYESCCCIS
jgi:hypothetical protein